MSTTNKEHNQYRESVCKSLEITGGQYDWLRGKGYELRELYNAQAEGVVSIKEHMAKIEMIKGDISNKAREIGIHIFFQTDPRGCSIYADNYGGNAPECQVAKAIY